MEVPLLLKQESPRILILMSIVSSRYLAVLFIRLFNSLTFSCPGILLLSFLLLLQ